jgi:nucleoside-diphosphate-sugar epimerase
METLRVALLGAASHIARGLIASYLSRQEYELLLYARSPERVQEFVSSFGAGRAELLALDAFGRRECDVIINCIGIGDPGKLRSEAAAIFTLTETWDNLILDYLALHPQTLYINFSSGAAYGGGFDSPVDETSRAIFPVNALTPSDYYGIAKLHSEARHRAASDLNIVDLRVFSYFSRYLDLSTRFLLSDVALALINGEELKTDSGNIVRDYIHPDDLVSLIDLCMERRKFNAVYDAYSLKPVGKFEMLDAFASHFGLRYIVTAIETVTATGNKENYYSSNYCAAELGYRPIHTSLESLCLEMTSLLAMTSFVK